MAPWCSLRAHEHFLAQQCQHQQLWCNMWEFSLLAHPWHHPKEAKQRNLLKP
ncbi:mCG147780 [Mus musculus]|nr:mCG147780 [Mus musculus]